MFEDIAVLLTASKALFGASIGFFLLSVVLFFLLDIKNVLLIESGHAERRTIRKMEEQNLRTGSLRNEPGNSRGGRNREEDGNVRRAAETGKVFDAGGGADPTRLSAEKWNTDPPKTAYRQKGVLYRMDREKRRAGDGRPQMDWNGQSVSGWTMDTVPLKETIWNNSPGFRITRKLLVVHTNERIEIF